MKQRNIAVCILLLFVTCGIYGIYWMIVLNDETNALSGRIGTSGGTVFLFSLITCGIYSLFWMYQMGNAVEMLHEQHGEPRGSAPVVYLLLKMCIRDRDCGEDIVCGARFHSVECITLLSSIGPR